MSPGAFLMHFFRAESKQESSQESTQESSPEVDDGDEEQSQGEDAEQGTEEQ